MHQHDYMWDTNHIIYKANELGLDSVESFTLHLDNMLSEQGETSPEYDVLVVNVLEMLHEIITSSEDVRAYDKGYEEGYEDARDEIRSMM